MAQLVKCYHPLCIGPTKKKMFSWGSFQVANVHMCMSLASADEVWKSHIPVCTVLPMLCHDTWQCVSLNVRTAHVLCKPLWVDTTQTYVRACVLWLTQPQWHWLWGHQDFLHVNVCVGYLRMWLCLQCRVKWPSVMSLNAYIVHCIKPILISTTTPLGCPTHTPAHTFHMYYYCTLCNHSKHKS